MRKILSWVAALAIAAMAHAQLLVNTKQVIIFKRSVSAATVPGDASKASVVTMHFTDVPLWQVLTECGRQIDASVVIETTNDGYTRTPSLDGVEGVCDAPDTYSVGITPTSSG